MAKIDDIKKEIEEYKELIADASVPQDEKDFAKGEIADLEKQLEALEKKTEKKAEPKTDKKEDKGEKKPEATAKKPKREEDEEEEADCDDLIEREQKASKLGYDIDELLTQAKQRKAKARERAQKLKNQPKKTPITKAKEKVEKTTKIIVKGLEKSAESGKLTVADLERLIAEYEEALKRFKKMLEKLRAEKMATGGGLKGLLTNREIEVKGSWYEPIKKLESYSSVGMAEHIEQSSSAGDWSGYFVQRIGDKCYFIPFNQENNGNGFTIYTGEVFASWNVKENQDFEKTVEEILEEFIERHYARGGNTKKTKRKVKQPKIVRTIFEEEEFEYGEGGGVPMSIRRRLEELRQEIRNESISYGEIVELNSLAKYIDKDDVELLEWAGVEEDFSRYEKVNLRRGEKMRRGGRTTMVDEKRDKMFRAKPSGKRKSKKIAVVEMKSGGSYRRRNSNQYYNDSLGNRSEIGGRTYYEGANNRSDKNKWS